MKVIAASEMARLEKLAFSRGASELEFMENAGKGIAQAVVDLYPTHSKLIVLAGKGNNAGDAYVAARHLLNHFSIKVFQLFSLEDCSALCKLQRDHFEKAGGEIQEIQEFQTINFDKDALILDGIFGTGFRGSVTGFLFDVIQCANESKLPILSIDIPSGLNGNSGEVQSVAIQAAWTLFLEVPKSGFFLGSGFEYIGKIYKVTFGLDLSLLEESQTSFILKEENEIAKLLPSIKRTRHKYERGFVVGFTGSIGMPGAAILSSKAALRAGAGIVKILCPKEMDYELSSAPWEIIRCLYDKNNFYSLLESCKKARAMYVGPGIGTSLEVEYFLNHIFATVTIPLVIDADALNIVSKNPLIKLPKMSILTPHKGEMDRLLNCQDIKQVDCGYLKMCQEFCEKHEVVLVLKGAPTFIFQPNTTPILSIRGDPGMATAGSGDVLTGILASLIASGLSALEASIVGVYLHGMSGEIAAQEKSSYCLIAEDLIEALPATFKKLYTIIKKIF